MNHQETSVREDCKNFANGRKLLAVTVSYRSAGLVVNGLAALAGEVASNPGMGVIIVDNTCGEDAAAISAAIAENHWGDWAMVVAAERNGGYAYGNNLAVRAAMAAAQPPEYYWLLNPDTEVKPHATKALLDFMQRDERIGIVGSALLLPPDDTVWSTAFRFPSFWSELDRGAAFGPLSRLLRRYQVARTMGDIPEQVDWLPGASMMVHRKVFESIGLLDEGYFLYYEETDFLLQAHKAGWTCWYVPESRVMHIAGATTGVTSKDHALRRRPQYVFDSRRRYFLKNHGWLYTVLTDTAFCLGLSLSHLRRWLQRQPNRNPPHLLLDSLRNHSLLKPKL
jgi:N-acetylglucosaminyl-diphospho-decaprenol L-rhamnosyltransferase